MSNSLQPYGNGTWPGSSVHGILQARILEWVTIHFSRESSWPGGWTWVSSIAGRFFTIWASREAPIILNSLLKAISKGASHQLLPSRGEAEILQNTSVLQILQNTERYSAMLLVYTSLSCRKVWFKHSDTPNMTKNPFLLNLFYFLWFRIPPLRTKCFEYMILSPQHSIRRGIIIHLLLMSRLYIT